MQFQTVDALVNNALVSARRMDALPGLHDDALPPARPAAGKQFCRCDRVML